MFETLFRYRVFEVEDGGWAAALEFDPGVWTQVVYWEKTYEKAAAGALHDLAQMHRGAPVFAIDVEAEGRGGCVEVAKRLY